MSEQSARTIVCVDAGGKILVANFEHKIACRKSHFRLNFIRSHFISCLNVYEYFVKVQGVK